MFRPGPAHSRALSFHNSILRNNRRDARAAARYSQAAHPPALRVGDACQPRLTPLSDAMAAGSRQLVQIRNCMEITIMQLPVLRRSLPVLSGRSPGLEVAGTLHAALPSPAIGRVVLQSSFPHLQWRNRAGSSPDFPVMPWWALEIDFVIPQRNRADVVLASASKRELTSGYFG